MWEAFTITLIRIFSEHYQKVPVVQSCCISTINLPFSKEIKLLCSTSRSCLLHYTGNPLFLVCGVLQSGLWAILILINTHTWRQYITQHRTNATQLSHLNKTQKGTNINILFPRPIVFFPHHIFLHLCIYVYLFICFWEGDLCLTAPTVLFSLRCHFHDHIRSCVNYANELLLIIDLKPVGFIVCLQVI